MVNFVEQGVFQPKQAGVLALQKTPAGDILNAEKDIRGRCSLVIHLPRVQQHRASSERPEVVLDLVILHGPLLRYDSSQQQSQLGDVPFPVSQLVNRLAEDIVDIEVECRAEGAARGDQSQTLIEDQERLTNGVDDALSDHRGSFGRSIVRRLPELILDGCLGVQVLTCVLSNHAYQRLRHTPPQLPPHRLRPRTSLMIKSSNIAPIAASTISETMPEPRWIPSCGNSQFAMKAPAIPTTRSPIRPKPVPWTIWPASQPAAMPTANMTRRLSPEMFMFCVLAIGPPSGVPPQTSE